MREVSARRLALSERIDRQRAEQIGWLVGSVARDLRSSVASVAYSADFLNGSGSGVNPGVLRETVGDIAKASRDLQLTLDALLDFARLGPAVSVSVQVREVLGRAVGSLRAHYRDGAHRLRVDVAPRAERVRVNPLVLEQIFVQLLLNAVEASAVPRCVIVTAFPGRRTGHDSSESQSGGCLEPDVCIRVWDDGPGIPAEHRRLIFEPFFTTKQGSPGLGLSLARQAAESLSGVLELSDDDTGTCFTLFLPRDEGTP
jgi:two-component system C4-dicarboxylate transport sensor histidine kinase DctB